MPRAIYIPMEGPIEIRDECPEFNDIQKYVGGCVARVVVPVTVTNAVPSGIALEEDARMVLLCNEDGGLIGLPQNPKASFLLWPYFGYMLVGNVVILDGFDI